MSERILKITSCPTLSGKSQLTYHVGCSSNGNVLLRLHASTGGGTFSQEWVEWKDIERCLKKQASGITSITLYPLFRGKSVNTPSFLLSALKHEGVVTVMKGKSRVHELADPKPFLAEVKQLMDAGTDLDSESKPRRAPARKKKVAPRKKTTPRKRAPRKRGRGS